MKRVLLAVVTSLAIGGLSLYVPEAFAAKTEMSKKADTKKKVKKGKKFKAKSKAKAPAKK